MVPYIIRQSIEIRLRFNPIPRLTASTEICVVSGMLCKMNNIPLPSFSDTDSLKKYALSVPPASETDKKLYNLLAECKRDNDEITEELSEVVQFGYENPL